MRIFRPTLIPLCLGLLTLVTDPSAAQENPKAFGQGTHALRGIIRSPKPIPGYAKKFDLTPIRDFSQIDPTNTVIIVLGDPTPLETLEQQTGGLRQFVTAGGALLVASDQPVAQPLSFELRVEIAGGFFQTRGGSNFAGIRDCPLVSPSELHRDHPIFRRVESIATNRPSALILHQRGPQLQTFARLPLAHVAGQERILLDRLPFLAGGQLGKGRVLVMADHSVFINDMMLQADTDNFDFAYNCIDWLTESGKRKQVLLIEEGEIVTNFNVSFKPPPLPKLPSQEQIVDGVNRLIAEAESKDQFNGLVLGAFGGWGNPREQAQAVAHQRILRLLLVLATLGLAFYGLLRLMAARQRPEKGLPLQGAAALPDWPVMDLRRQAMQENGNCWEAARQLARRCLESAGCHGWDHRPKFIIQGGIVQRLRIGFQLRRLWRLAAKRPRRVSPRQLQQIADLTERMKKAFEQGTVKRATETQQA